MQALKLAAYAFTAAWVAGVAQVVPWIGALIALAGGIYSIYLFYLGLPTVDAVSAGPVGCLHRGVHRRGNRAEYDHRVRRRHAHRRVLRRVTSAVRISSSTRTARWARSRIGRRRWKRRRSEWRRRSKSGDAGRSKRRGRRDARHCTWRRDKVEALAPEQLKPFVPNSLGSLAAHPDVRRAQRRNGHADRRSTRHVQRRCPQPAAPDYRHRVCKGVDGARRLGSTSKMTPRRTMATARPIARTDASCTNNGTSRGPASTP